MALILVTADAGGIIITVLVAVIVVVSAIKNAIEEAKRRRRQAEGGELPPPGPPQASDKGDLSAFLDSVRRAAATQQARAAGRTAGGQRTPPRPQPREEPAYLAQPVMSAHRAMPARARVAPLPNPPKPAIEEPILLEEAEESSKRPSDWLQRLPEDPLRRAIVLSEIIGPPASRRHSGQAGPIAQRR